MIEIYTEISNLVRLAGNPCNFSVYGRKVYSQALR